MGRSGWWADRAGLSGVESQAAAFELCHLALFPPVVIWGSSASPRHRLFWGSNEGSHGWWRFQREWAVRREHFPPVTSTGIALPSLTSPSCESPVTQRVLFSLLGSRKAISSSLSPCSLCSSHTASLLFLKHTRHNSQSQTSALAVSSARNAFPQASLGPTPSPPAVFCSNVTFYLRLTMTLL